jgi:hypothetical protein
MISKVTVMVNWKLNQQAIADSLCININKPDVMCHGTCVLKDRLQQVDEHKNIPLSDLVKQYNVQPFICAEIVTLNFVNSLSVDKEKRFYFYCQNYYHFHHSPIFTPPDAPIFS